MTILAILRALTHTPTHTLALNLNVSLALTLTLTLQEDIILISMGKDLESMPLIYQESFLSSFPSCVHDLTYQSLLLGNHLVNLSLGKKILQISIHLP